MSIQIVKVKILATGKEIECYALYDGKYADKSTYGRAGNLRGESKKGIYEASEVEVLKLIKVKL